MQYENLEKAIAIEWDTLEKIINYELKKILNKKIYIELEREDTDFQVILKGILTEDVPKIKATFGNSEYEIQKEKEIWLENDFSKFNSSKIY